MVTFQTVFCHDKHGVPMGVKTPGCDTGEVIIINYNLVYKFIFIVFLIKINLIKINQFWTTKIISHSHTHTHAQYKLEVDWDGRPSEFTCYQPKNRLPVDQTIRPLRTCFDIPSDYMVSTVGKSWKIISKFAFGEQLQAVNGDAIIFRTLVNTILINQSWIFSNHPHNKRYSLNTTA